MVYFILPDRREESKDAQIGLIIGPAEFRRQLRQIWPHCTVDEPPGNRRTRFVGKSLRRGETILIGGMPQDLQTITVEPRGRDTLAEFVIWHRGIVSADQELVLSQEGWAGSLEVTRDTSEEGIFDFTGLLA